ncbi:hypothetical protein L8106_22321 [Lyngbya sp. PCC 8106]|nr:hypothetical protein L8106_22321 [Lyngbya sp. PCC 8106]
MLNFFRPNRPINYQSLLKFLISLGYWSLIIAIFLSIWMFKGLSDKTIQLAKLGLKTFQFFREKCKNITLDSTAPQAIFNGII